MTNLGNKEKTTPTEPITSVISISITLLLAYMNSDNQKTRDKQNFIVK
jgi:hypothetical protein